MPYIFKKYYPMRSLLFFFGEGILIFLTIILAYSALSGGMQGDAVLLTNGIRAAVVTAIFQLSLYFFDLYDHNLPADLTEIAIRMVQAFGSGCIALAGVYYLFPAVTIATPIFWSCYIIICILLLGWRTLYNLILKKRLFSQPIMILGTGKLSCDLAEEIERKQDSGYKIAAFVGPRSPQTNPYNAPVFSDPDSLHEIYRKVHAEKIIVALDDRRGTMPVSDLLQCKVKGIPIEDGITFYEYITGKIAVENVNPAWLIFSHGFQKSAFTYAVKRFLDISLSLTGLLLSLPVSLVAALIIKLESPGPVFYVQERVGERGISFKIVKFRSMRQDAEKDGAVWASRNDNRVTRFGGFARKVRIDEIPQMWNVLKGDMSFVGPRPERPVFVEELTRSLPYYSLRHSVKPGITGWAQVCYPYGASQEDALRKLEYDLYYIKNISVNFDLLVIFRTIKTVLFQKGSR